MGSVIGFGVGVMITLLAAALGARDAPLLELGLFSVAIVVMAASTTLVGALAAAVQCWGLWDGFLINDLGQLSLSDGGWQGLAVFGLVATGSQLASTGARRLHRWSARRAGRTSSGSLTATSRRSAT
jgi:hypothetical protein